MTKLNGEPITDGIATGVQVGAYRGLEVAALAPIDTERGVVAHVGTCSGPLLLLCAMRCSLRSTSLAR